MQIKVKLPYTFNLLFAYLYECKLLRVVFGYFLLCLYDKTTESGTCYWLSSVCFYNQCWNSLFCLYFFQCEYVLKLSVKDLGHLCTVKCAILFHKAHCVFSYEFTLLRMFLVFHCVFG
jgi:hypothetical protein